MPEYTFYGRRHDDGSTAVTFAVAGDGRGERPFCARRSFRYRRYASTFEWGYSNHGPAQLALAILLMETSPDEALRRHMAFQEDVISRLPWEWSLAGAAVQSWLCTDREKHPLTEEKKCSY